MISIKTLRAKALYIRSLKRAVEKDLLNRKERKIVAKNAKLKHCVCALCDLCEKPLRPLRLIDFDFFEYPY